MDIDYQKVEQLDRELIAASKHIKVLSALGWQPEAEELFLSSWHQGNPRLPKPDITPRDLSEHIAQLDRITTLCNQEHPIEKFLAESAESYATAGRMLGAVGTPDFTRFSTQIYGRPDLVYRHQNVTAIDAAKFMIKVTDDLLGNQHIQSTEFDISAAAFADWLTTEVTRYFTDDKVEVVLDPEISSKALAGAHRIRVRSSARFSELDRDQLLFHEAYVHTATILNGKKQKNLKSLGLGAPRTTRTQEGIAVMAELITNSIDISRLRRVALRVLAVQLALDGADFIELFKFFLDAGQSEIEAVRSAQRIFRGGDCNGGIVFTKDTVYLQGLFELHTFIRLAIRDNRPEFVRNLFAGRLTMADVYRLAPFFENGWLSPPRYIPVWASDLRRIASVMAYSAFIANIKLDQLDLERVISFEEELKTVQRN